MVVGLAGCSLPDPKVHVTADNATGQEVQAHVVARFDRKGGASTQVVEWSGTLPPGTLEVGTFQRPCQDASVGVVTYNATVGGHSFERAQEWAPGRCHEQRITLRVTGNATAAWEFA
ncbi:MAG TPA: hypothetical protein VM241_05525 [Candidatus Thermoplasmatota archaeon]|nr:hypothetical protein [Candidatus Thermoplasmatota archaeon]